MTDVRDEVVPGDDFPDEYLHHCSELFSAHYGKWSVNSSTPGKPISQRAHHVKELLKGGITYASTGWLDDKLVGYDLDARARLGASSSIKSRTELVVADPYPWLG